MFVGDVKSIIEQAAQYHFTLPLAGGSDADQRFASVPSAGEGEFFFAANMKSVGRRFHIPSEHGGKSAPIVASLFILIH